MKVQKIVYKKYFNSIINGVSIFQINKSGLRENSSQFDLKFSKFKPKFKDVNLSKILINDELTKKVKSIRKQKGFPVNGQRTRSNSRTSLYLKNSYTKLN